MAKSRRFSSVAWYGWFELRLAADADAPAGPVDAAGRLSGQISTWISDAGAVRLGLAVVVLVALAVAADRCQRRIPVPAPEPESPYGPGPAGPFRATLGRPAPRRIDLCLRR